MGCRSSLDGFMHFMVSGAHPIPETLNRGLTQTKGLLGVVCVSKGAPRDSPIGDSTGIRDWGLWFRFRVFWGLGLNLRL